MTEKIALITGASRGLGAALAEVLSRTHHIVAVARTSGALEELDDRVQANGGNMTIAPMDITNRDAMAHLCKSLFERWGSIDIWAHTAIHASPLTPASSLDAKDWEKSVTVNVMATGILIPYVAPLLTETSQALFFDDPQGGEKFFSAYGIRRPRKLLWPKAGRSRLHALVSRADIDASSDADGNARVFSRAKTNPNWLLQKKKRCGCYPRFSEI